MSVALGKENGPPSSEITTANFPEVRKAINRYESLDQIMKSAIEAYLASTRAMTLATDTCTQWRTKPDLRKALLDLTDRLFRELSQEYFRLNPLPGIGRVMTSDRVCSWLSRQTGVGTSLNELTPRVSGWYSGKMDLLVKEDGDSWRIWGGLNYVAGGAIHTENYPNKAGFRITKLFERLVSIYGKGVVAEQFVQSIDPDSRKYDIRVVEPDNFTYIDITQINPSPNRHSDIQVPLPGFIFDKVTVGFQRDVLPSYYS